MCSLHLSLRKLLFATDRGCYREPQPIKLQNQVPRDTITYNTLLYLKLRQSCGRWLGGSRSQRIRDSVVWLYLLATSEATPIKPYQQDCPNLSELNKEDNNKRAKLQGETPQSSAPHKELQAVEQGAGAEALSREKYTHWLFSACQPWKHTHKQHYMYLTDYI